MLKHIRYLVIAVIVLHRLDIKSALSKLPSQDRCLAGCPCLFREKRKLQFRCGALGVLGFKNGGLRSLGTEAIRAPVKVMWLRHLGTHVAGDEFLDDCIAKLS